MMPLAHLLVALGIPQVGRKTGKVLAKYIGEKLAKERLSEDSLKDILLHLTFEELEEIKDIGPVGAGSIVYYFEENEEMVTRLLQEVHPTIEIASASDEENLPLSGKSFCVTGSFE